MKFLTNIPYQHAQHQLAVLAGRGNELNEKRPAAPKIRVIREPQGHSEPGYVGLYQLPAQGALE